MGGEGRNKGMKLGGIKMGKSTLKLGLITYFAGGNNIYLKQTDAVM